MKDIFKKINFYNMKVESFPKTTIVNLKFKKSLNIIECNKLKSHLMGKYKISYIQEMKAFEKATVFNLFLMFRGIKQIDNMFEGITINFNDKKDFNQFINEIS